jgi:hypothetical protein
MRVEEFLQTLNTSIEHYAQLIKIFIASITILIAYNYFYYPSLFLLSLGVPAYLYFRVYRRKLVDQVVVNTNVITQPSVELSAPAPAPAPIPVP